MLYHRTIEVQLTSDESYLYTDPNRRPIYLCDLENGLIKIVPFFDVFQGELAVPIDGGIQ